MKYIKTLAVVLIAAMTMTACSTYKIKPDMDKAGVVNKTPDWYVDYKHETWKKYQETATAVSPDMELAVKKATILAKAKLADRINGEMNNRTTINKNEAGTNENLTVEAGSQDTVVNMISDTLVRHYKVSKQEIFMTRHKSYRVYVMLEISKKDIEKIIAKIDTKPAVINTSKINDAANKVLN